MCHCQSSCTPLPSLTCCCLPRAHPYLFNMPSSIVVRAPTFFNMPLRLSCTPLLFQRAVANCRARPYLFNALLPIVVHAPTFSTCRRLCCACPFPFIMPLPIVVRAPTFSTRRCQSSCVLLPSSTCRCCARPSSTRHPCVCPYPSLRRVCAPFFNAPLSCAPLPFIASCTRALPYCATVATLHRVVLHALPPRAAIANHQTRVVVCGIVVRGVVMRVLHTCRWHAL
jgi:hypothetical protein